MASQAQVYFSSFQIVAMLSIDENLAKLLYEPTPNCEFVIFDKLKQMKAASDSFLTLRSQTVGDRDRELDDEAKAASKDNSLLLAEKIKTLYGYLDDLYEEQFSAAAHGRRTMSQESLEQLYIERMTPLHFRTPPGVRLVGVCVRRQRVCAAGQGTHCGSSQRTLRAWLRELNGHALGRRELEKVQRPSQKSLCCAVLAH